VAGEVPGTETAGADATTAPATAQADFLLQAAGLRKSYGGTVALANGSLAVRRGEIHGLLGENGAGKSTLIKCLAGTPAPDEGTIIVDGQELPRGHSARHAAEAGLAFIHQEGSLIETLSVEENIALTAGYPRRAGFIDWPRLRRFARDALEVLGVELDPSRIVAELPQATRTVVAIARALAQSARIVVLDEPTASVSPNDARALFRVLKRLSAAGNAVVFVSHRLDEVYELCDRIAVLRDGVTVASDLTTDISQKDLISIICGHEVAFAKKQATTTTGEPRLQVRDLKGPMVGPISFSVWPGEIVGFTGLSDAGHYEIGELIFGLKTPTTGALLLAGMPFAPDSPREALKRGVAYLPPDRIGSGLAREMTLAENLFLNPQYSGLSLTSNGILSPARERVAALSILRQFQVRPPDPDAPIASLSGGNAQKVLVARWLHKAAEILIVNDATVGVDVRAREEIYEVIRRAATAGTAVLLITSDFEEVQSLSGRAFVFVRGILSEELVGDRVTVPEITGALARHTLKRDMANTPSVSTVP
jgi:ribose transport system ATP-binding protein